MDTSTPLFAPTAPNARESWPDDWKIFNSDLKLKQFEEYADTYFKNAVPCGDSTCFAASAIPHLERALQHNLTAGTPLNITQVSDWLQIVNSIRIKYQPDNFTGIWYRCIWDNSEQTNKIKTAVHAMLNNCSNNVDVKQFLAYSKDNYDIIDVFYGSEPNEVFDAYCSGSVDKYLTRYIFSSRFVERYSDLNSPGRYINRAYNFVQKISEFMQEVITEDPDRLEFFISVMYAVNDTLQRSSGAKEQRLVEFQDTLNTLMKSNYPAEYSELQAMLSLGIVFKPKDIMTQIRCSNAVASVDVPMLF